MARMFIHPRVKQKILERDNFKCVSCQASGDFNSLEIDHVISIKDGGKNDESNLQTLCYRCNMDKYYGKEVTNKYFLNLSPLERLKLIKDKLIEYKDLTYAEFKVIFTQDELFRRLRIDLMYLSDLFFEISGKKIEDCRYSDKYIKQRDGLMYILRDYTKLTYRELEKLFKEYDFDMDYTRIAKICLKNEKNKQKSEEKVE